MKLPLLRGECEDIPRPCPHMFCRFHLDGKESCSLDFADRVHDRYESVTHGEDGESALLNAAGGHALSDSRVATLREVAEAMGCSAAQVLIIEQKALAKLRRMFDDPRVMTARKRLTRVVSSLPLPAKADIVELKVA